MEKESRTVELKDQVEACSSQLADLEAQKKALIDTTATLAATEAELRGATEVGL